MLNNKVNHKHIKEDTKEEECQVIEQTQQKKLAAPRILLGDA
jgi:hypothetical protein